MDFELPPADDPRRLAVRRWLAEHPGPTGRQLAEAGYVAPHWPAPWGLDADGMLNVFSATDGQLVNQVRLYAGGSDTGSPGARLLNADESDRVLVGAGFLSLALFDGKILGGDAANCLLG